MFDVGQIQLVWSIRHAFEEHSLRLATWASLVQKLYTVLGSHQKRRGC